MKGFAAKDAFEEIAASKMKHAEAITERLYCLGGISTTKPSLIFVGKTLKEMIEQDVKDEAGAIKLYKEIVELARKEGDETTNRLLRGILQQEEDYHDSFTTLVEEI